MRFLFIGIFILFIGCGSDSSEDNSNSEITDSNNENSEIIETTSQQETHLETENEKSQVIAEIVSNEITFGDDEVVNFTNGDFGKVTLEENSSLLLSFEFKSNISLKNGKIYFDALKNLDSRFVSQLANQSYQAIFGFTNLDELKDGVDISEEIFNDLQGDIKTNVERRVSLPLLGIQGELEL